MSDEEMTESMREVMSLDGDVDKLAAYYRDWADSYDADVGSHGYGLPASMVVTLERAIAEMGWADDAHARAVLHVTDAACGTGLVGAALHAAGFTTIRGVDLSPEMIAVAEARGIYDSLESGIDLNHPPPEHLRRAADAVTAGGVFTVGHVPPESLANIARLARPGGIVVASTRAAYQEQTDFASMQQSLIDAGLLAPLVHVEEAPYTMDSTGDYWAWRVLR